MNTFINELKCESCDGNGYLEVTCEDDQEYIQACDTCDHFGILSDRDALAREAAIQDGYELDYSGLILK